jgi:hypothetical protein
VLRALSHAHCLQLLDHAINPCSNSSSLAYNVLLVFPAYEVRQRTSMVAVLYGGRGNGTWVLLCTTLPPAQTAAAWPTRAAALWSS